jgi:Tfp pilus assembly protein PilN
MAQQNVNLYDASLRLQRDWLSAESFAAVVGGALLAVAVGAAFTRWQVSRLQEPARESAAALQAQQSAIQDLARHVETLRPDPKLVADVASTQATLEQRQAALQMLKAGGLGDQDGHAAALQAFARQSLDGLWLTGIMLDKRDMALRGRAMSPDLIPAYVGRLNQEPALQGRSFRALDIARPMADAVADAPPAPPAAKPLTLTPTQVPARLASFVEFSLAGSAGSVVAGKEARR